MGDMLYSRIDPRVDEIARVMIKAWEEAEHTTVNVSYIATFADMARAVVEWIDNG